MKNGELCVPMGALAEAGEGGAQMTPEMGDEVELIVTGRVTRTEGGEVYIQPTTVNGQPIEDKGGESAESMEDQAMEEEIKGYGQGGGSMALMVLLFLLLLRVGGLRVEAADLEFARARYCSGTIASNIVAITPGKQVFDIEIDNYSGSTLYLMIFDSSTNQLAGATPHITPVAIPTGSVGGKSWVAGMPFDYGVNVALSTTPRSLTNASTGGIITITHSPRK